MDISVVIIVKNASLTIEETLRSIKAFNEVILYDNGSTDKTIEIAKNFKNVKIIKGEFFGFGPTKNLAAKFAKNKWIFSLDADEVVSSELLNSIMSLSPQQDTVYSIVRYNYYKGKRIRSKIGKDVIFRLYNKEEVLFNDKLVHESLVINKTKKQRLSGIVKHNSYQGISDFINKIDEYSNLYANTQGHKKKTSPSIAFYSALWSFVRFYIIKYGFIDGYRGLLFSVTGACTTFYKKIKLYEVNKFNKE
jgi:glycosyltransferase involved in cell wall biosynthesis